MCNGLHINLMVIRLFFCKMCNRLHITAMTVETWGEVIGYNQESCTRS